MLIDTRELHRLLELWAAANRGPAPGSVGGAWGERLDRATPAQWSPAVEQVERAINRTFAEDRAYRRIVNHYWLGRESCHFIAINFRVSETAIKDLLFQAESRIGEHLAMLR